MKLEDLPIEIAPPVHSLEVLVDSLSNKLNDEWDIKNLDAKKEMNGLLYAMDSVLSEMKSLLGKYSNFDNNKNLVALK